MIHPRGFKDSENIIIINSVPYFHYTGLSYKDKVKNGLSLEYVFQIEDIVPMINHDEFNEEVVQTNEAKENLNFIDYEENYEFYQQKEFQARGVIRKVNWSRCKKRQSRNTKKNYIKLNGYNDKLFVIEQNLPELFYETEIGIDCEYSNKYDDNPFYIYDYDW